MKYEYMKESEQMLQYFQFPKFLLKLRISQTAKFLYMILHFERLTALTKTSETGSTEASALTPSCIHISFFSRLVSVSNCCKIPLYDFV